VIEIDVRRQLGSFRLDARFCARADGLIALFGRSGCGKTTLVNLIAGLERPDDGRIAIADVVLFDKAAGIDLPPERRHVGYVFQESRLFPHFSVRGNLTYGMRLTPPADRHHRFDDIVALLDLGGLLERRPATLSGGEKQRVAIGRALLASPRLLLMDEPLASLDIQRKNEILPFIERLRERLRLPIIYVSHAIEEVVRLADTMVLMSDGGVAATGPVADIMSRLDLHPLTGRYEAGAVLNATVCGIDKTFGLSELALSGADGSVRRLWVPNVNLPLGTALRMRVRARDVSLSLGRPKDVSILNVIEGRVAEIARHDEPQVDVLVDIGQPLMARITRKSLHLLNLHPGVKVFALIKTVAIDRHTLSLGSRGGARDA